MNDLAKLLLLIDPNINNWLQRKTIIEAFLQSQSINDNLTLFQQLLSCMARNFQVRVNFKKYICKFLFLKINIVNFLHYKNKNFYMEILDIQFKSIF